MTNCIVCGLSKNGKKKLQKIDGGKKKCTKCGIEFDEKGEALDDGEIPVSKRK